MHSAKKYFSESDSVPEWKSIKLLVLSGSENGYYFLSLVSYYKRQNTNLTFLGLVFQSMILKNEDNVYEHFSESEKIDDMLSFETRVLS